MPSDFSDVQDPTPCLDRVLRVGELIGEVLRDESLLFPVSLPAKEGVDRIVLERLTGLLK